ncbi:hypothetical protein PT285_04185 [Lactobacillus sp. ESL0791]|uniref:hypothetical protein n=1 Tax=Lactobacillus sp. ESL0791 TaxID=2983234 RepID=UPI0023F6DBB0|nr:hypothetical protein [Lactobacillus sp. ESL0791]MDF7638598.1 hypothetical protein [Lactobacillus sp. ESL0791]
MNKSSNSKIGAKIWWSFALFVNVILTIQAIFTQNVLGCIMVILFGLFIAKYGDPIIFEKYNNQRKIKYRNACKQREVFEKKEKLRRFKND